MTDTTESSARASSENDGTIVATRDGVVDAAFSGTVPQINAIWHSTSYVCLVACNSTTLGKTPNALY